MTGPYDAVLDAWLASGRPVVDLAEILAELRAPAVHEAWMAACPDRSRPSPRTGWEQMVGFRLLHPDDQAVDVASARTVLDPVLVAALLVAGARLAARASAVDDDSLLAEVHRSATVVDPVPAGLAGDCLRRINAEDGQR
ncbi:MAG TPA: hypothetical protein VFT95_16390 [Micromonosporaceae bacterium]|nr:hypothetical protein [Micromonosporaceae bacterium]